MIDDDFSGKVVYKRKVAVQLWALGSDKAQN
jgi:hypothetical protein